MIVEIITIGDEILIGQTVDTNSAWIGQTLNKIGIKINRITSVQDEEKEIIASLNAVREDSNIILMTGGLGPTKDDITKRVLTQYFGGELVRNNEVLERIESFFKSRNREILDSNRRQADLPNNAKILLNDLGTASGMWFEKEGKIYVSMPGVPYEMKHLMTDRLIPMIKERFKLPAIYHKTIMTEGIGESFLVEKVKDWENSLTADKIKIAYLPSPGIVKIRLTAEDRDLNSIKEKVDAKANELKLLVPQYIFGEDDLPIEVSIGELLKHNKKTIATAESCTGGYIAHLLTSISGSSEYYLGSIVSYANDIKQNVLDVSENSLNNEGAVSKEVVEQMAIGARNKMKSDFALATSGVAGPLGGSDDKPVGTVWIALAHEKGVYSKKFNFEKDRARNIRRASLAAMGMLRRFLQNHLN